MKTIFLDMDGVVADFNKFVKEFLCVDHFTHSWPDDQWRKIASNHRLYRHLDKTPEADQLVKVCRKLCHDNNWKLFFLTAVPHDNDMPWAFYDKVCWAQEHYPGIPVHFGPHSRDKWRHCTPGDILIDDRPSNCTQWAAAGGYSILHEGDLEKTLKSLKNYLEIKEFTI